MKIMNKLQKRKEELKKNNKGFSLVELIIVIAIMAILVGIVGTQVIPYINKSKEAKDYQIINSYSTAAMTAYSSNAEKVTADTTIDVYGTNADAAGKPAKTIGDEVIVLTGYKDLATLKAKMGSEKGKNITKIEIVIDLSAKKITTTATGSKGNFDAVVAEL